MQIQYTEGPPTVDMGAAGKFVINEPREVEDQLAERLLAKTTIKFERVGNPPSVPPLVKGGGKTGGKE
jgi:hypothetical protein